jgi:hypothetical protein
MRIGASSEYCHYSATIRRTDRIHRSQTRFGAGRARVPAPAAARNATCEKRHPRETPPARHHLRDTTCETPPARRHLRDATCETPPARHHLPDTTDILATQITRSGLAAPPDPRAEHVHSPLLWSSNIFVRCPPARLQAGGQRTYRSLQASRGAASSAPRTCRARRARHVPARCRCAATVDPPRRTFTSEQPLNQRQPTCTSTLRARH